MHWNIKTSWSNLPCDWPSTAWAYSEQETENGPRLPKEYRYLLDHPEYSGFSTERVNFFLC